VAPSVDELGKSLPQFEISEVLGQGGMGAVYKARQLSLNRFVAIKLLPEISGDDEFNFAERFEREAQAMAQMNHSNIATVYDFGKTEADSDDGGDGGSGLRYIVMEYVDGPDLHELIHGRKLTIKHVMGWIPQICSALDWSGAPERLPKRDSFGWIPRDRSLISLGSVSPTTFSVIRVRSGTVKKVRNQN